jgi:hypothetical protein
VCRFPPPSLHDRREVNVQEARMYQLIRQHGTIAERRFEIEFLDAGVGVYDFTFG